MGGGQDRGVYWEFDEVIWMGVFFGGGGGEGGCCMVRVCLWIVVCLGAKVEAPYWLFRHQL